MSFEKKGHLSPAHLLADFDQKLTEEITGILRREYEGIPSPVKRIALKTGIAHETIRNWYKGKNSPRLAHILMLARCYPTVMALVLKLSGHGYLCAHVLPQAQISSSPFGGKESVNTAVENVPINVPINSWPDDLNERQVWFLAELRRGVPAIAVDIVRLWGVSDKTAKRDVADLKKRGLVAYVGARKSGRYEYKGA